MRRAVEGKGMSIQAFAIVPKIREVDAALAANPEHLQRVFEVHPEVTFSELNGGAPLSVPRKKVAGRRARLALLRDHFGDAPEAFVAARPKSNVAPDDVVDAFAALWSAQRIKRGSHRSLPTPPGRDGLGLPMAIFV